MVVKRIGGYTRESTEADQNAREIYGYFYSKGWTLNAICGLLGNIEGESDYNPWRWEGDDLQSFYATDYKLHGYGLFQFTANDDYPTKYIRESIATSLTGYAPNFSDRMGNVSDAYAQMEYLDLYADYIKKSEHPLSYSEYKASTLAPDYLASTWLWNYERPRQQDGESSEPIRQASAMYNKFSDEPVPPTPPTPLPKGRKMPVWMMIGYNVQIR